jgi:DNA repair exonuclease SbcCD ATPase subunit
MYQNINLELKNLRQKVEEKSKIRIRLEKLRANLEEENLMLKNFSDTLEKEKRELEKLENVSITSVFYSIIGKIDAKLEREKQKFYSAQYNYEVSRGNIEDLKRSIREAYASLEELQTVEVEYEIFIKEKERMINCSSSPTKNKIKETYNKINELKLQISGDEETVKTCNNIVPFIDDLISKLDGHVSKNNNKNYDLLLNMGDVDTDGTLNKNLEEIIHRLLSIKFQLEHLDFNFDLNFDLDWFFIFVDNFLDNISLDRSLKEITKETLSNAIMLKRKISDLIKLLKGNIKHCGEEVNNFEEYCRDIIENE